MGMSYSNDLRLRVPVDGGVPVRQIAALLRVSVSRPVPYGHWKTTTFVAGLRCDGLTAPFVIDGPINGEWFYVEKVLAPTLRPGTLVPHRFGDLRYPTFA